MWLPLTIGQERSIRLVDDALADNDGPSDHRPVRLAAMPKWKSRRPIRSIRSAPRRIVHRMLRAPDGTIRLIVQGLERIRVEQLSSSKSPICGPRSRWCPTTKRRRWSRRR